MALRIEKQQVLTFTFLITYRLWSCISLFSVGFITHIQENARKIAMYLSTHPRVKKVYYAGLPDHPGHHLHFSQVLKTI